MDALNQDYAVLAPFKTLNYSLKGIYDMEFFKYRFGKIPRSEFDKFESYLDPDMDEIFLTCLVESEYVYGVFFAPIDKFNEVAKDFRNIHFDEIPIPKQYKGFPNDECLNIAKNKAELDEKIKSKMLKFPQLWKLTVTNLFQPAEELRLLSVILMFES